MKKFYCEREKPSSLSTETNDIAKWDVCCDCGKVIDCSYEFINHSDGEDY